MLYRFALILVFLFLSLWDSQCAEQPRHRAELIFPLNEKHNHAPGIVECGNGDLLVSWYRGSGEREADDVAVLGARLRRGQRQWTEPFLMVDTPGFPDGNTAMHIDSKDRLWLFWPVILANTWQSCITSYRVASRYEGSGTPRWDWQGQILLRPQSFVEDMESALADRLKLKPLPAEMNDRVTELRRLIRDKLSQRLGWQPRCKPTVLKSGRILLPLYSDTFSVSLMAISDDQGASWFGGRPLAGYGNIQPAVLERRDGSLVAYMRENGPVDRIRISESRDHGVTWGSVGATEFLNPGSGLDAVKLKNGNWVIVYNDTVKGRRSLAVSISDDEGKSWKWTRHLERQNEGEFHYPAVIQGRDGMIHVVYSYFVSEGKSMKHAVFNETWVRNVDKK